MSAAEHKALLHTLTALFNAYDLDALEALYTAAFTVNGQPFGVEGVKRVRRVWRAAFPDIEYRIENLIARSSPASVTPSSAGMFWRRRHRAIQGWCTEKANSWLKYSAGAVPVRGKEA